jgi:hypothetical protein
MPSTVFLTLPLEIRLGIYKRVFAGAELKINVTLDDNNKFTITRMKSGPNGIKAACLATCSQFNVEAFPIIAGAINLVIYFEDKNGGSADGLNLTDMATLPYAPSFLSRFIPFISKLTYEQHHSEGCCFGLAAFPNLKEMRFRRSQPLALDSMNLPHLTELALCKTKDATLALASAARDEIMFHAHWTVLRELGEVSDRKFRIYVQTVASYGHHHNVCTAAPEVCLCRRQEYPLNAWLALVRTPPPEV